jgi:hypothetical protein
VNPNIFSHQGQSVGLDLALLGPRNPKQFYDSLQNIAIDSALENQLPRHALGPYLEEKGGTSAHAFDLLPENSTS